MEKSNIEESRFFSKAIWKNVKRVLGIIVLVFLCNYLWENKSIFNAFEDVDFRHICGMYLFIIIGTVNNSRLSQLLINSFEKQISLMDSIMLQNATRLLNLVPMKIGMLYRANILKKRYSLSYTTSTNILVYKMIFIVFMSGFVGMLGVILSPGSFSQDLITLTTFFLMFICLSLVLILVPFPQKLSAGRFTKILCKLSSGRQIIKNRKLNSLCLFHLFLVFFFFGARLGFLYSLLGYPPSFFHIFILGAVGYGSTLLAITPEALGIREVLLSSSMSLTGLPFEVGIMVSLIDRAFALSWTFLVGSGGLVWFWLKARKLNHTTLIEQ